MKLVLLSILVSLVVAMALAASPAHAQVEPADNGGPDILLTALITIGSVGVAAALATIGYLVRLRIGYEPHRPPEGDEGDEGH